MAVGSDNRAYLVGADLSLQWFDISAPMQPSLVGTLSGIEAPSNDAEALVAVHGGLAVAASTRDGYRLVDVSNGSDVTVLYEGATPSKIFGVAFFESYLVFASEDQGLVVVDIAQPSNPSVVATIGLGGVPRGVHVKDHRVFVSTSAHFLKVIDLTLPCLDDDLCTVDGCLVDAGCTIVADTACDDLDPCTVDSCDPYEGCIYTEDMTCTEAGADPP